MSDQTRPNGQAEPDGDQTQPGDQAETRRRVTVREAARVLGTTVEGVRSRIKRGSLDSMRVEGAVYVLLTPDQADRARPDDQTRQGDDQTHPVDRARPDPDPSLNRLVDEQREMIDWLKREVERKDTILMQMAQRIPELEAAPEPRESSVKSSENGSSGDVHPETERRSWWRRLFEA